MVDPSAELSHLSIKIQFFNLLLLTGAAFTKPSMMGADLGYYAFDGSMLAETVHSCTAGPLLAPSSRQRTTTVARETFSASLRPWAGWMPVATCSTTPS